MTNQEVIKELVDMLPGYPIGSPRYEALEEAIKSLEKMPRFIAYEDGRIEVLAEKDYDIIFLCDGKACGEDHDCMECRHTLDIHHAKNFHYNPVLFDKNYYLEVEE